MTTVSVEEVQAMLPELIHNLRPGDEVVILKNNQPVARLVSDKRPTAQRPQPGLCKGMIEIIAEDDEHLNDFSEYMS